MSSPYAHEAKPTHPPIIEISPGDAISFGNVREELIPALRRGLLTKAALRLLAKRGELIGVVVEVDESSGERTPTQAVDLSDRDFGTRVFLDEDGEENSIAKRHDLYSLPRTIGEVYEAREKMLAKDGDRPEPSLPSLKGGRNGEKDDDWDFESPGILR